MVDVPNKIRFNGHDLSEILYIQKFNKGVQLGRTGNYRTRVGRKGAEFVDYSSEVVTFTMDFLFKPEVKNKKEKLAEILNVDEPKPLYNSSEPGLVYYAFPVGSIDSDEESIFGNGTITWEIPDGVAFSEENLTFESNGASAIVIDNPGTEPMELDMSALFYSDNGFLGIKSDDGSVSTLFGDMEEVTGESRERSETLFDDHFFEPRNAWTLNKGVIPPVTANPRQQGYVSYKLESKGEGFAMPSYGPVVETDWHGPSLSRIIPKNSQGDDAYYWTSEFRVDFNPTGAGSAEPYQVGHSSITYSDINGKVLVAIIFEDTSPTALQSNFAIYFDGKRVYDTRNRGTSYYVTARPGDGQHIRVEKYIGMLQVTVTMAPLKDRATDRNTGKKYDDLVLDYYFDDAATYVHKVTWYAARYKGYPAMTNNLLRAINFRAHKVGYYYDIPNKFKDKDWLRYTKQGRHYEVRLNEHKNTGLMDPGSTPLIVPPGQTILHLTWSSFAVPAPHVSMHGRARYTI